MAANHGTRKPKVAACEPWLQNMPSTAGDGTPIEYYKISNVTRGKAANGLLQEDGPSMQRKEIRGMSESLLNSISVRAAHAINKSLAPAAEPLVRGQNNIVFPRFAHSSKSPHYNLPNECKAHRRGEKRVLFPTTGGASLTRDLAGVVDLTEPLFEDIPRDADVWQDFYLNTTSVENKLEFAYDSNNNRFNQRESLPYSSENCSPGILGHESLNKETELRSTTAFQLFSYKVIPLLRVTEEKAMGAIERFWDELPTTEKYAFEMQKFVLRDELQNEFVNCGDAITEKVTSDEKRRKFPSVSIDGSLGGEQAESKVLPLDCSSNCPLKSPCTPKSLASYNTDYTNKGSVTSEHGECQQNGLNFLDTGDMYFPHNFEVSFSSAGNSTRNFSAYENRSGDKRNSRCASLSDLTTSISTASWYTDDHCASEDFSFIEEDIMPDFGSDSDCNSSQTSTVTSVIMRPREV